MENESIFDKVRSLNIDLGGYVVVSGGVLEAHGIREAHDVDLVVTQEIFDRLVEDGWQVKAGDGDTLILYKEGFEAATDWNYKEYCPDPKELIANADIIEGCAFAKLDEVVKFKKVMNRQKDKEDIALITEHRSRS